MRKELDIRLETLQYTAHFAEPSFHLWGGGGIIVGSLFRALADYGVTLEHFQVNNHFNANVPVVVIQVPGKFVVRFAFNRMEFEFTNFTSEFFASIPTLIRNCTEWLHQTTPDFHFATHNFGYFCHSYVKDGTTKEILDSIAGATPRAAGIGQGNGTIFHSFLPEKNWKLRTWFDQSLGLPGALFVGFAIETVADRLDYNTAMNDGRERLIAILEELNLSMPEVENLN